MSNNYFKAKNYFKGKDIETGLWVTGFYVCLNGSQHRIYSGHADINGRLPVFYDVIPETVVQFTNEYDKRGKEICEHDILIKFVDGKKLKCVVEYSDGAFGVRFADGSGQLLCVFADGCEVVGNAYDALKDVKNK